LWAWSDLGNSHVRRSNSWGDIRLDPLDKGRWLFGCRLSSGSSRDFVLLIEGVSVCHRFVSVHWDLFRVFRLHLGLRAIGWGGELGFLRWGLWRCGVYVIDEAIVDLCRLCVVGHPATVNDKLVSDLVFPSN